MITEKIPIGALHLIDNADVKCSFASGQTTPKLSMTAYSGKVIKNHFWWGNLAIDLDGMSFKGKKFPILENHDTSKKIAFTAKPVISYDNRLVIDSDKTTFVDTEESKEFRRLSKDGFPYQASIHAKPTQIQRLTENETADVNGFSFKGPGTIWRKCEFKEASVCVFGYDTKTQSSAFSTDEEVYLDDVEDYSQLSDDDKYAAENKSLVKDLLRRANRQEQQTDNTDNNQMSENQQLVKDLLRRTGQ